MPHQKSPPPASAIGIDIETAQAYAVVLKALSDPFRLRILDLLPDRADCELVCNVNELIEVLGGSQPNMSHHLKILSNAGLVVKKKMCNSVYYHKDRAKFETVRAFLGALKKNISQ